MNLFELFIRPILVVAFSLILVACGGDYEPPWIGTKQLGVTSANTIGNSVATDISGNVYVTGSTTGGLDGNTLAGTQDFFVTQYNSTGNKQYTRQLGVAGASTVGNSIATDSNGNVYVAGVTSGSLDGNTLAGTKDFFVTKYDSSGVKQYTRQLGVAGKVTQGFSVAPDTNGNVYVTGTTTGGLDGNTLTGNHDFFVTKYDSNGIRQFTRQLGVTSKATWGVSVATDASGNVYVAGWTFGGLDGNTLTGKEDVFITKYDSSGVKQYTQQLGVAGTNTSGNSVATDGSGNVYVTGSTNGGLDGNTLTGGLDLYITKYDSAGNKLYTRQLGVAGGSTVGNAVVTDDNGNVYVAGSSSGTLNTNYNISTGDNNFIIIKYNSSGEQQYIRQLGVTGTDTVGNSVATDTSGNVFVAGATKGGLDGSTLTGTQDFFVTKFNSDGMKF